MPCFESHVSLEFITDVADGLLLYSGPLAQLQTWDHEDFMAIGNNTSCLTVIEIIVNISLCLLPLMLFGSVLLYIICSNSYHCVTRVTLFHKIYRK